MLAIVLAALIGLSLGMIGSGGSIVTLPVLVYVARIPAHHAVGMSLVIVGFTSGIGAALNILRGNFHLRATLLFSSTGITGAFIGGRFTHLISPEMLLLMFGVLMLIVATRMLTGSEIPNQQRKCRPVRCLIVGFTVGLLTGFLGVGGGFLILPALVLFAGLEMRLAIGTSLAIIALNSVSGFISQMQSIDMNWSLTLQFLIAAAAGMLAGTAMSGRVPEIRLRRAFSWGVLLLGTVLILENLSTSQRWFAASAL